MDTTSFAVFSSCQCFFWKTENDCPTCVANMYRKKVKLQIGHEVELSRFMLQPIRCPVPAEWSVWIASIGNTARSEPEGWKLLIRKSSSAKPLGVQDSQVD